MAEYIRDKSVKTQRFVERIGELDIHPQLKYTLIRISGYYRCKYHTQVNEPAISLEMVKCLVDGIKKLTREMLRTSDQINDGMLYDRDKLGCPNYLKNAEADYKLAADTARKVVYSRLVSRRVEEDPHRAPQPPHLPTTSAPAFQNTTHEASVAETSHSRVELQSQNGTRPHRTQEPTLETNETTSSQSSATPTPLSSNSSSRSTSPQRKERKSHKEAATELTEFLFWQTGAIKSEDFTTAVAMRLGVTPDKLKIAPAICNCGERLDTDQQVLSHVQKCDKSSGISHTTRHNRLRDTMCETIQRYGITVNREPLAYKGLYENGHERPDLLIQTLQQAIAVDLKITKVQDLAKGEKEKKKIHEKAVKQLKHKFFPALFTPNGGMGQGVIKLMHEIRRSIHSAMRSSFIFDFKRSLACSLATSRAEAWQNFVVLQVRS